MGIIDTLKGFWIARKLLRDSPVLAAMVKRSGAVFDSLPLKEYTHTEAKNKMSTELFEECHEIAVATDPFIKCREAFATAILTLAKFQDLIIPPEPE